MKKILNGKCWRWFETDNCPSVCSLVMLWGVTGLPCSPAIIDREVKLALLTSKGHVCQPIPIMLSMAPFSLNSSPILKCKIFERISLEDCVSWGCVIKDDHMTVSPSAHGFSYSFRWSVCCSRWWGMINTTCFLNMHHWQPVINKSYFSSTFSEK